VGGADGIFHPLVKQNFQLSTAWLNGVKSLTVKRTSPHAVVASKHRVAQRD
jgi:hypothetical protein